MNASSTVEKLSIGQLNPLVGIIAIYILVATLWILFGHYLLPSLVSGSVFIGLVFDGLYILGSAVGLYVLIQRSNAVLQQRSMQLEAIIEGTSDSIFVKDVQGRYLLINTACAGIFERSVEDIIGRDDAQLLPPSVADPIMEDDRQVMANAKVRVFEETAPIAGAMRTYSVTKAPYRDARGRITGVIGIAHEITQRKEAEEVQRGYIRYLESMHRIAEAIGRSFDADELLTNLAETIRSLFQADRAWLGYPCDINADFFSVAIEATVAQYPGAFASGEKVPIDRTSVPIVRKALDSAPKPIVYCPMPKIAAWVERFTIRSQMIIAIRPRFGKPWLLGLHQCAYERAWTSKEQQLFQEIGVRVADVLSAAQLYQRLKESEERLKLALEGANDGLWDWDIPSGQAYLSPRWQRILGFEPGELEPYVRSWEQRIHPGDRERVLQALNDHLAGHTPYYETEHRLQTKDGRWLWILDRGKVVKRDQQGKPLRAVGTHTDISARKRIEEDLQKARAELERRVQERTTDLIAINRHLQQQIIARQATEAALRDSEERFRQLAEHIQEVFWMTNAHDRRVIYVSPAYETIWGRSRQDLYQRQLDWLDAIVPQDRTHVRKAYFEEVAKGDFNEEYRILRPDGSIRWIRDRGFPIRNTAGEIYRIVGIAQDITERKQADEQARQQQAELAHMGRLSLAGEMASGLAHELNQPLAAIATLTDACLIFIRSGQINSEELTKAMEQVAAQAQRAGEIIRRLRDFTRKTTPQQTLVNINVLIQEVVGFIEPEARQQMIALQLKLSDPIPPVLADPIQIQQVIINLLRNAIEAMGQTKVDHRKLTIHTAAVGSDAIEISICDTGPGISAEVSDYLFHPFFTTKANGMGLGLSISKSIIEAHGGRLWANSKRSGGAAFHFSLSTRHE